MADFTLRRAAESDRRQIIGIWQESFGDSEEFIAGMLDSGLMAAAVGAEKDGRLRSVMFAFDGLRRDGESFSYLYALCTEKSYRSLGLGKAVTHFAAEEALGRGADAVFLRPADSGLEAWYAASMGAEVMTRYAAQTVFVSPSASRKAEAISSREYPSLRRGSDWEIPEALLLAQELGHRHFGGAFLRCSGGIVCAEKQENGVLVREMLSSSPALALAETAAFFSVSELHIIRKSDSGSALMLISRKNCGKKPETEVMPFTLD